MEVRQRLLRGEELIELEIVGIGHAGGRRGHAMPIRLNSRSAEALPSSVGAVAAASARSAAAADRADVSKQLVEEALLAAQGWRRAVARAHPEHQLLAGALDR